LNASGGGVDINASSSIDLNGGTVDIHSVSACGWTHTTAAPAADLTIALVGATDSSLVLSSTGTGADAIALNASVGGLDISAALGLDLVSGAATAGWTHTATGDTQDLLIAVAGAHDSSILLDSAGTGADAIGINASAGGLTVLAGTSVGIGSGTTTIITAATDLTLDASGATSQIVLQTGTDTSATSAAVWDDSGDVIYSWGGDGYMRRGSDRHEVSHRAQYVFFDDFDYQTFTGTGWDRWVATLDGGGAGTAVPALTGSEMGTTNMSSGTAGDATATVALAGFQPVQMDGGGFVFEARVRFTSATTVCSAFIGLTDQKAAAEMPFTIAGGDAIAGVADDAVGFQWDTSGDTDVWFGAAIDGGGGTVDTGSAATNVGPTQNVYQTFRLEVSADGATINGYIDDTLKITMTGDIGVSPDVNLYPFICILSDDATPKLLEADWVYYAVTR